MNWEALLVVALIIAPGILWWWATIDHDSDDECSCGTVRIPQQYGEYGTVLIDGVRHGRIACLKI